ncbi:ATP-dependent DNA helicase [Mycena indigotica]|uniref:ATP-dependent DNA helicase n=1 Tax=Mycena indigotica TaxID=2126181 RepID=A0A8H6W9S9_9AGAR|nr:ATP-dependent DNA helicase [Mycena indigotica]KAF7310022.1 ATP-dependent DNA helicase [Mycena indigotica]
MLRWRRNLAWSARENFSQRNSKRCILTISPIDISCNLHIHTHTKRQCTDFCSTKKSTVEDPMTPRLALANNMWIGDVPFQLEILTLPEQLLVALYFPAAAANAGGIEAIAINEKLRGNVSTFRLPTAQIIDMAAGQIVPRPSLILASLIGVTFVGVDRKALPTLKTLFRVRRQRVFEALLWLKQNNTVYRDITIDSGAIQKLPEDDIPSEISENVRYSTDVDAVGREHAGYAPVEFEEEETQQPDESLEQTELNSRADPTQVEIEGALDENCLDVSVDAQPSTLPGQTTRSTFGTMEQTMEEDDPSPAVFPLHAHGIMDVGGDNIPESTVFAHAVDNLLSKPFAQDYAVRKGSAFINEYGRRDENGDRYDGGPSNPNHLLGAFPTLFPYGLGGLEVDREEKVFGDSDDTHILSFWRSGSSGSVSSLAQLKPKDLLQAAEEEEHRVQISNPLIRLLRKHLTAVRARVQGTDENRVAIRAQIWGMTLKFNPPSIWMTINLSDTGDPIAQVLAGQEINLDDFIAKSGPSATTRDAIIGADPFAAAEYFHLVIRLLFKDMLGIKVGVKGAIERETGVLGVINGYIGTVEAQGRGSLHLHLLLWLRGAPTAQQMQEALQSDEFLARVKSFIKHNIRADVPGGPLPPDARKRLARSVAFSRPVDPRTTNYKDEAAKTEKINASVLQSHECTIYYCLKNKSGRLICKRGHPWPTYDDDWVDRGGSWGPKRSNCSLNPWNPPIFHTTRSNMDIKLLTNAWETKDIAFYITLYIAKKQVQAANASAILAKSHAFQQTPGSTPNINLPIHKLNQKLLQQCANTLSRQYELSGPEVVSYLMGWGDRYISHTFVKIYWDRVVSTLRAAFPHITQNAATIDADNEDRVPADTATQIILVDGRFTVEDQLSQYADRGEELESMNLYDYFLYTYHDARAKQRSEDDEDDSPQERPKAGGRPKKDRYPYRPESERKGRWLPSRDSANQENYAAQILVLLKPWRELKDLVGSFPSLQHALDSFMASSSEEIHRITENIEYFHQCSQSAKRRKNNTPEDAEGDNTGDLDTSDTVTQLEGDHTDTFKAPMLLTEADGNGHRLRKWHI